jgi:hypothetical protein
LRYPREFSPQARNRIEAEQIRAYQDFDKAKKVARWDSDVEVLLRQCILRVFLAFAREACAIGKSGTLGWSIDKIDAECQEFLRRMTIQAWSDKGFGNYGRFGSVTSNTGGSIEGRTMRAFEATAEWQEYQELLLEVAGDDIDDDRKDAPVLRSKPGLKIDVETAGKVAKIACRPAFTSEARRIEAVAAYCNAWQCSEAALARTAVVHPGDLSKWKKDLLSASSDKSVRIERVLTNQEAPTPPPERFRES